MIKTLVPALLGWIWISLPGQAPVLPKPTGESLVGVTYLRFVDSGRKELFDDSGQSFRELTVKVWYPADEQSNPEPYLPNAEAAVRVGVFPEISRIPATNSSRDVPPSSGSKIYPVLIFNHGWGGHYSQNSVLMEDLASHGYVVFSLAHHNECGYSADPDGRAITMNYRSSRLGRIWKAMQNPKAMESLRELSAAKDDAARLRAVANIDDVLGLGAQESPKYWAEDISFLIDRLADLARNHALFRGRLDLDRVGVFGMSLGGLAAAESCKIRGGIKAGVSLDGMITVSLLSGKLPVPFLFLISEKFLGYGTLLTAIVDADSYVFGVKAADHMNFTDYSLYPIPAAAALLGKIDGKRAVDITNVLVRAFFDKYVKGNGGIDLVKKAAKFQEIEITAKFKSGAVESRR